MAIYRSIDWRERTLENAFISAFSAIENIILYFRKSNNLVNVLDMEQWKIFKKDIEIYIKEELIEKIKLTEKERRNLIYEKVGELNRISISAVFNKMCAFYSIDLHDLWPLIETNGGISLSNIRNKIVHGDTFSHIESHALMAAYEHLRWTLERLILSILGWPIEKSRVSGEFLSSHMAMAKGWEKDRKILSS